MCGRYSATKSPAALAAEFDAVDATGGGAPGADYNVAPTKPVITVVDRHPRDEQGTQDLDHIQRSLRVMRWGLVPHWAKDRSIGGRMFNARSDTVASKAAFRGSLARRRCLVPADGWYEWRRDGRAKQPFYMTRRDGASIAFAGLWSTWRDPADTSDDPATLLVSCAILTTDAVGQLTGIHPRMPLQLPTSAWAGWLNPDSFDVGDALTNPDPALVDDLELRPISDAVNNVRHNGPELLVAADRPEIVELDRTSSS
ncbi:MAG TPA: SOS response-associated peptidase [Pseudonocardiaceae bacterium]